MHIVRKRSKDALRLLADESYDFIYIDASHETADVLTDAVLGWHLLKPGGVMIFDDYGYPPTRTGIDAFLTAFDGQYREVDRGWQLAIIKNGV